MFRRITGLALASALALVLIPSVAWTQPAPDPNRGGPGGPPNFDPAQIRGFILGYYKDQLDVSDEEWDVLRPKIDKVVAAQGEILMGGSLGFFGRRGGPGGGPGGPGAGPGGPGGPFANIPEGKIAKANRELREVLDKKDAPAAEIARKLEALREIRKKVQGELEAARKEVKELVTPRQEATLVLLNVLE